MGRPLNPRVWIRDWLMKPTNVESMRVKAELVRLEEARAAHDEALAQVRARHRLEIDPDTGFIVGATSAIAGQALHAQAENPPSETSRRSAGGSDPRINRLASCVEEHALRFDALRVDINALLPAIRESHPRSRERGA